MEAEAEAAKFLDASTHLYKRVCPSVAQCIITRKKSVVIISCSKTLLDYYRSFFKTSAIVKPLREIETDAKVAYT